MTEIAVHGTDRAPLPLGLNFISSASLDRQAARVWFSDALALVELAEGLGWSHVKTVEHYLYDWGGASANPAVFLAAAAARTTRMRIATGAVLPAFRHPVVLASELAVLDQLSGGRLDVGFARGFLPGEFAMFEVPMGESRARFEEGVSQILALWRGEPVTDEGQFCRLEAASVKPLPLQEPHPPTFVAAVSTPESYDKAGAAGHHLMVVPTRSLESLAERLDRYRSARASAGFSTPGRIQLSIQAIVGSSVTDALQAVAAPFQSYNRLLAAAVSDPSAIDASAYPGYTAMLRHLEATTPAEALDAGTLVAGSADDLSGQLDRIRSSVGEVEFSCQVNFGGIGLDHARETMHALTEAIHSVS